MNKEKIFNKVAFLEGNRVINPASVKKHKESLKTFGRNLMPIIWVTPQDAERYTLIDAETGEEISQEDRNNYEKVIIDGQHRYTAAKKLYEEGEKSVIDNIWYEKLEVKEGDSLANILREINVTSFKWNGSQYIRYWNMADNKHEFRDYSEVIEFAAMIADEGKGISSKTINKILFFNEKFSWGKMQDTEKLDAAKKYIDRAKQIWKVYEGFKDTPIYKKSYIIDIILESGEWKETTEKIKALTEDQRKELKETPIKDCEKKLKEWVNQI